MSLELHFPFLQTSTSRQREDFGPRQKDRASVPVQATRGLLATDPVILNHGQVTWTTPELAPPSPNYHANGRTFQLSTDLTCIAALHDGSLVVLGSNS
ncbi:hypothetical protein TNCV_113041 [Trichonephila clavipes]|nr:hypothetical protein TNCV_113041 [Trichonephila clavipes]